MRTVVLDVGGVLVDWDPRHLYRSVFETDDEMDRFLAGVCTWEWHHQHDAGVPFAESIPARVAAFPQHESLIRMWESRYLDMVAGEVPGVADIVRELHASGTRLLILSNMPSEVWAPLRDSFDWMALFDGAVVSGDERVVKPDPAIYRILVDRFGVVPAETVFVDDRTENVEAARALGFDAILFTGAEFLRRALAVNFSEH